jgi:hypothetical protein
VVSEKLRRKVERQSVDIASDVERLRFVRDSIAKHEAALSRRSMEMRRMRLVFFIPLTALVLSIISTPNIAPVRPKPPALLSRATAEIATPKVWLVERKAGLEIYSNGLRIDDEFLTYTRPRAYRPFDRKSFGASGPETRPAGIVFHTTESRMAPFE